MVQLSMRAIRIERGLSQEDLAKAVHVTKKTVGSWEKGKTRPKLDKIEAICKALDWPYDGIRWNV